MNPFKTLISNIASKSKTTPYSLSLPSTQASTPPVQTVTQVQGAMKPTTTTSSPAAVDPTIKTPAAQTYIKSQMGNSPTPAPAQSAYDATTGARTSYGASIGAKDMLGGQPVVPTDTNTSPTPAPAKEKSAYLEFLRKQFDPTVVQTAQTNAQNANMRLANIQNTVDETSLKGRHAAEDAFDQAGGTTAGATQSSAGITRKSNRELADLAVQEGAAARTAGVYQQNYKNLIDAGSSIYQAEKDAAELSKPITVGNVLYAPQGDGTYKAVAGNQKLETSVVEANGRKLLINSQTGETIKNLGSSASGTASGSGTGTYVAGANPVVDSWAERIQSGQNKITDIPASQAGLRNQVAVALNAMGNSPDGKPTTTELGKAALTSAKDLLEKFTDPNNPNNNAVGGSSLLNRIALPGTDRANFINDFNTLKAQLSLEGVKYLKGQGQVSDAERALLAQATSKLSLGQSEAEFKKTLDSIINKLNGTSESGTSDGSQAIPKGTDGTAYGFPGYVSDGSQWVLK